MSTSHFFATLNRLRWIKRWGLKRNVVEENVMEHSWQVATIAHALALLHNQLDQPPVNPERVAVLGLYHDVSEVITGDMPTPIKYHSSKITQAYKAIEAEAEQDLLQSLPRDLQGDYEPLLCQHQSAPVELQLVKSADMISAYLKCDAELRAGNPEFKTAFAQIEQRIRQLESLAVQRFMQQFVEAYSLTLDDLLNQHDQQHGR
jgi:5'-deoxynucleotidase